MNDVLTYNQKLYKILCKLRNEAPKRIGWDEKELYINEHIHLLDHIVDQRANDVERVKQMSDVIISYSNEDYNKQADVTDHNSELDGLAVGLNMLGEELAAATISLHEKEVLLKEIHHRVKNNLQLISSLLNLHANATTDEKMIAMFKECQNRVQTIALIHKKLYQTDKLSKVNFGSYLLDLVDEIIKAFVSEEDNVQVNCDVQQDIYLDLESCIPAGLIVNELIMNVFKHAFDETIKDPVLILRMEQQGSNVIIKVQDNGKGLAKNFDYVSVQSMGLTIVKALVNQMKGGVNFNSGKGGTLVDFNFQIELV